MALQGKPLLQPRKKFAGPIPPQRRRSICSPSNSSYYVRFLYPTAPLLASLFRGSKVATSARDQLRLRGNVHGKWLQGQPERGLPGRSHHLLCLGSRLRRHRHRHEHRWRLQRNHNDQLRVRHPTMDMVSQRLFRLESWASVLRSLRTPQPGNLYVQFHRHRGELP